MFVSSLLNAVSISQLTSSQIPLRMSLMQSILACLSTPPLILLPQTDDFALLVNCTRKPPQRKERALQSSKGVFHGTQLGKLPSHTPSSPLTKTHYYVSVVSALSVGSRGDDCATGFGERVSLFTSNCKWNSRHDVSSTFMHALSLPPSLPLSFLHFRFAPGDVTGPAVSLWPQPVSTGGGCCSLSPRAAAIFQLMLKELCCTAKCMSILPTANRNLLLPLEVYQNSNLPFFSSCLCTGLLSPPISLGTCCISIRSVPQIIGQKL